MRSSFLCLSHLLQFCNVVREKHSCADPLVTVYCGPLHIIVLLLWHTGRRTRTRRTKFKEQQSKPIIRVTNRLFCLILNSRHNLQFTKCILHLILNDTWFRIIVFEPPDYISLLKVLHSEFSFVTLFLLYPLLLLNCFFFIYF